MVRIMYSPPRASRKPRAFDPNDISDYELCCLFGVPNNIGRIARNWDRDERGWPLDKKARRILRRRYARKSMIILEACTPPMEEILRIACRPAGATLEEIFVALNNYSLAQVLQALNALDACTYRDAIGRMHLHAPVIVEHPLV